MTTIVRPSIYISRRNGLERLRAILRRLVRKYVDSLIGYFPLLLLLLLGSCGYYQYSNQGFVTLSAQAANSIAAGSR